MYLRLLLMIPLLHSFAFSQDFFMYVGTYTQTDSKGIYVYRFNANTGRATLLSSTDSAVNPSYLAISPNRKFLFSVNETHGANPGSVSSYAINANTGRLKFLNQQPSGGDDPCYVAVHKNNGWIAVGNYSGGNASILKVGSNGLLKPYTQLMQDTGKGSDPKRQEKPHVHSTVFSPDFNYLFTPDLGLDKIMAYRFNNYANRPLTPANPPFVTTQPGSGPRHLTFHPNGRFAYLIEEMAGTIAVYRYNNGKLTELQTIKTHPSDYKGNIGSADIHVSPDGRFVYASNRGDANSITIFAVNQSTGRLQLRGYQSVLGKTPRNFVIDPSGNYLLVANQGTDNMIVFKRNKTTGGLTPTNYELKVPKPVCIKMM